MSDNDNRARWAGEALRAFATFCGMKMPEDRESALSDFLGDLHHWADQEELDWNKHAELAESNYLAETQTACPHCYATGCYEEWDTDGDQAVCYRCRGKFDLVEPEVRDPLTFRQKVAALLEALDNNDVFVDTDVCPEKAEAMKEVHRLMEAVR